MTTQEKTMTTTEVASRLVSLCRKGDFETAQKELFADDVISIEPYATPEFAKETKGLDAVIEKGEKFQSMVEKMHNMEVGDPIIAHSSFACTMRLDVTMKGKERMDMTELCVYQIKDGKISKEEFVM